MLKQLYSPLPFVAIKRDICLPLPMNCPWHPHGRDFVYSTRRDRRPYLVPKNISCHKICQTRPHYPRTLCTSTPRTIKHAVSSTGRSLMMLLEKRGPVQTRRRGVSLSILELSRYVANQRPNHSTITKSRPRGIPPGSITAMQSNSAYTLNISTYAFNRLRNHFKAPIL